MSDLIEISKTNRLVLRQLEIADAPFILQLVNQPAWLQYIGDRGVKSLGDAISYIENGPKKMYSEYGVGLYLVERISDNIPIGMCGLIKRDTLPDNDIGFAFMNEFWGRGYAYEACEAILEYARRRLGLKRVVAITHPDNLSSIKLLEKVGLQFEKMIKLDHQDYELKFFGINFQG